MGDCGNPIMGHRSILNAFLSRRVLYTPSAATSSSYWKKRGFLAAVFHNLENPEGEHSAGVRFLTVDPVDEEHASLPEEETPAVGKDPKVKLLPPGLDGSRSILRLYPSILFEKGVEPCGLCSIFETHLQFSTSLHGTRLSPCVLVKPWFFNQFFPVKSFHHWKPASESLGNKPFKPQREKSSLLSALKNRWRY